MGAFKEARYNTLQMLELVEEGVVNKDNLIHNLLMWMSDDEVERFMAKSGYITLLDGAYEE